VQAITPGIARRLGQQSPEGVLVTAVEENAEAAAGVRPGDIIREIDRRAVRTMADFRRLSRALRRGSEVTLRVQRGGERFFVAFTIP
jgi:serine protease Do